MTWWDHETDSVWTQPWGRALTGPLKGTTLKLLPFSLTTWDTWRQEHPDTLALVVENQAHFNGQRVQDGFVIGLAIGDVARAYPYEVAAEEVVIEDWLGDIPVLVHVNPQTRSIHVYLRQLGDGTLLTFTGNAEQLVDDQTGSIWTPERGLAIEGELSGQAMRELPYITSFDWAWHDFYPHTTFYSGN